MSLIGIYGILEKAFNKNNNGIEVNVKDQTTEVLGLLFHKKTQDLTIASDTSVDDSTVTVTSLAEPTNGNLVCFKQGSAFYQGMILSHSANGADWDIGLDSLLDYAFTISATCCESTSNMAVDGSVTPQAFHISPKSLTAGIQWDITGISGSVLDQTDMDDNTFGGIASLTRGIILRKSDGTKKNIANIKSNGQLKLHTFNVSYSDKAPAGYYGLNFFKEFAGQENNGVAIRLDATAEDELLLIIQDDLTDLDSLHVVAHGHVVDD